MKLKMFDEKTRKVIRILKKNLNSGFTITELVNTSKLSRHIVLKTLALLEGANKVSVRKVGMAKIYLLNKRGKK